MFSVTRLQMHADQTSKEQLKTNRWNRAIVTQINTPKLDQKNLKTCLAYLTASSSTQVSGLLPDAIFVPKRMSRLVLIYPDSTFNDAIISMDARHLATASKELPVSFLMVDFTIGFLQRQTNDICWTVVSSHSQQWLRCERKHCENQTQWVYKRTRNHRGWI